MPALTRLKREREARQRGESQDDPSDPALEERLHDQPTASQRMPAPSVRASAARSASDQKRRISVVLFIVYLVSNDLVVETGNRAVCLVALEVDPWLCVPASRRVCLLRSS